ncbi:MAG: prolipoprotein diacylglyceryl transferase [Bdellovibrionaceae bacterium]|nr:prolipoprotein diacylglyceryl transferase [Pseudobdellovibrionaceae bacterium]
MLPEFSLGSFVTLPTYFVSLSLLVSLLFFLIWKWAAMMDKNSTVALNLAMIIVVTGFVGGRLFHVIYEAPDYYRRFPQAIFMFWMGGYVFFGGMALATLAGFLYLKKIGQPFWSWFDLLTPVLALGYGLGRFSCFLAGCCYGGFCDLPWAVNGRHPTQIYALLLEVGFAFFLARTALRNHSERDAKKRWPVGALTLTWFALHAIGRLVMEHYREDFRGPMLSGTSISTWLSLVLLSGALAGLFFLWAPRLKTLRTRKK